MKKITLIIGCLCWFGLSFWLFVSENNVLSIIGFIGMIFEIMVLSILKLCGRLTPLLLISLICSVPAHAERIVVYDSTTSAVVSSFWGDPVVAEGRIIGIHKILVDR